MEYNVHLDDKSINAIKGIFTPSGNIDITDTEITDVSDYATAQVVDENLVAGNIKKDVEILGVTGTYPSGNKNITDTNVTDVADYATAQVVDANLKGSNIKSGVTILGINGSYTGDFKTAQVVIINTTGSDVVVSIPYAGGISSNSQYTLAANASVTLPVILYRNQCIITNNDISVYSGNVRVVDTHQYSIYGDCTLQF